MPEILLPWVEQVAEMPPLPPQLTQMLLNILTHVAVTPNDSGIRAGHLAQLIQEKWDNDKDIY